MTTLAPTLEAFFTERLLAQKRASANTVASYRDALRLLLCFAQQQTGKAPSALDVGDLDAPLIGAFLTHLERVRGNAISTRNARLAAVHSLFRFAALRHPEHAAVIQRVLAIPPKRADRVDVEFLSPSEIDALVAAPDRSRWVGRRDHALLVVAVQTGLRVSEITGLTCADVHLGGGPHVRCRGKGRKERCTPLAPNTVRVLAGWLRERAGEPPDPVFPTSTGRPLSRDAVALAVARHTSTARRSSSTLAIKAVTPHTLRHTAAMLLLHAGVDTSVIALWLGHESAETTQIYIHADLALKERALARVTPTNTAPGRYRAPDSLLGFLESL